MAALGPRQDFATYQASQNQWIEAESPQPGTGEDLERIARPPHSGGAPKSFRLFLC
jgi:hypothetical protein